MKLDGQKVRTMLMVFSGDKVGAVPMAVDNESAFKAMLDADLNARYWGLMARRYSRYELIGKIFLALIASASVASWKFWLEHEDVWKGLSVLSAVLSVVLPILNLGRKVTKMGELAVTWTKLMYEYEMLDASVTALPQTEFDSKFRSLREKEVDAIEKSTLLPADDERLNNRCRDAVLASRGLTA